ncbi:MAG TPA: type II secretion system F family protein [Longimicrobiales bacterium]|nr:type II secretion system F family protein [Longimicrobiales bacterium]
MQTGGAWIAAALVFISVALVTTAVAVFIEWFVRRRRERGVTTQLERLNTEALETLSPGAGAILRGTQLADAAWVEALTGRVPHLRDVQHLLQQAALEWSVSSYLAFAAGAGFAAGVAVFGMTANLVFALIAAAFGAALPFMYVSRRRSRRMARFEEQFPGAVDLLGRAIRAGHPLSAALKMVADEVDEPVAGEFRAVFEEQRFGIPFSESLAALADRVPSADVRIFVTAVLIQREVGGNLTEILDNLSDIIRQRFTLQRQVKVLTAEGRYSVYVLTAMPVLIAAFVYMTNREYLRPLWETEAGRMMLYGALVAQVVGYLWMNKLTKIEF